MARILVIEDNASDMKLVTRVLQNAGHTVLCAVDAETGLMDIVLPGMDGLAATALLKTGPTTAAIPIIAVSSMLTKNDEEKALAAGCDLYIAKPFHTQDFYAAIEDLLKTAVEALLLKSGHILPP